MGLWPAEKPKLPKDPRSDLAIRAIASVYPPTKAARYRFFSQPAFPASLSSVQISGNNGASRDNATEGIRP
jgi:hypothetical protein